MILLKDLNFRAQEILRHIVEAYCETGDPVGSKSLSERLNRGLSSASIRHVMADLERLGLLHSPHTSSGRVPTEAALHLFVHAFLEVGNLSPHEKKDLETFCKTHGSSMDFLLEEVTTKLSGLTQCAGFVLAPKTESPLKHVEFVLLSPGKALLILISEEGMVENRLLSIPLGIPSSSLVEASNYLTSKLQGRTLSEVRSTLLKRLKEDRSKLDILAATLIEKGLAIWGGETSLQRGTLILRGQGNLIDSFSDEKQLEKLKGIFDALDQKEILMNLLDAAIEAEGVQIFVGSENPLFEQMGCSVVVSPYKASSGKVLGAIGVIGPTRINYGRIIPMVDYTAKMISKFIEETVDT